MQDAVSKCPHGGQTLGSVAAMTERDWLGRPGRHRVRADRWRRSILRKGPLRGEQPSALAFCV